jgi:hypothetical protein
MMAEEVKDGWDGYGIYVVVSGGVEVETFCCVAVYRQCWYVETDLDLR